jgi:hypothetical protein
LSLKSVIVNFGFLNLFLDIWIQNTDPDPGSRLKLNADPTGSGSETLVKITENLRVGTGTVEKKIGTRNRNLGKMARFRNTATGTSLKNYLKIFCPDR